MIDDDMGGYGGFGGLGIGNPGSYGGSSSGFGGSSKSGEFGDSRGYGGFGGLGIGNPNSYGGLRGLSAPTGGPSYSPEAMNRALAALDQQMNTSNVEHGLAQSPFRGVEDMSNLMGLYTGGRSQLADQVARQNLENNFKGLDYSDRQLAKKSADAVGMGTEYQKQARKESLMENVLNSVGSVGGAIAGGGIFGPVGASLGSHYGGNIGTYASGLRDLEEVNRAAGLIGPATPYGSSPLSKEEMDNNLINRIILPRRRG